MYNRMTLRNATFWATKPRDITCADTTECLLPLITLFAGRFSIRSSSILHKSDRRKAQVQTNSSGQGSGPFFDLWDTASSQGAHSSMIFRYSIALTRLLQDLFDLMNSERHARYQRRRDTLSSWSCCSDCVKNSPHFLEPNCTALWMHSKRL